MCPLGQVTTTEEGRADSRALNGLASRNRTVLSSFAGSTAAVTSTPHCGQLNGTHSRFSTPTDHGLTTVRHAHG